MQYKWIKFSLKFIPAYASFSSSSKTAFESNSLVLGLYKAEFNKGFNGVIMIYIYKDI